jgi:hypothetical protein
MKRRKKPSRPAVDTGVAQAIVDNPDWRPAHHGEKAFPRKITASVNIRESAIATLAAKGVLDPAQVAAADRFRALWERVGGRGVGTIDLVRERVDGGERREPVTASALDAGRELRRCRLLLGEYGYWLVRQLAGERRSLHEFCPTRRERDSTADWLRRDLTALAKMWGYETRR